MRSTKKQSEAELEEHKQALTSCEQEAGCTREEQEKILEECRSTSKSPKGWAAIERKEPTSQGNVTSKVLPACSGSIENLALEHAHCTVRMQHRLHTMGVGAWTGSSWRPRDSGQATQLATATDSEVLQRCLRITVGTPQENASLLNALKVAL